MNTMHGSKRTEKTKKRTAPLERSRTQRQKPRRTNNEEFALTILPPKHDCVCGRETCCYPERGHCGRFFTLTNLAFSGPLLSKDFPDLLGCSERFHVSIYLPVAKAATEATPCPSGESGLCRG